MHTTRPEADSPLSRLRPAWAAQAPPLMRVADIIKFAPIGRSTWLAYVRSGVAPPGKLVTPGMRVWTRDEVLSVFTTAGAKDQEDG